MLRKCCLTTRVICILKQIVFVLHETGVIMEHLWNLQEGDPAEQGCQLGFIKNICGNILQVDKQTNYVTTRFSICNSTATIIIMQRKRVDMVSTLGNSYIICTGVWTVTIVRQQESNKDQSVQKRRVGITVYRHLALLRYRNKMFHSYISIF